jgi:hypothetical protein
MTVLNPVTLDEAEMAVAVANTPFFIARRLREDPATRRAYELHGPDKLLQALETVAPRDSRSLAEVTEIYFYLVALSFEPNLKYLQKATNLAARNVKWFTSVAESLLESARANSSISVSLGPQTVSTSSPRSSISNSPTLIIRP